MRLSDQERLERNKKNRERYAKKNYTTTKGSFVMRLQEREPIPDYVWIDRDLRMNAPMTINMMILGDPVTPRWQSNAG